MKPDLLHIEPTNKTPEIILDPKGTIKIKGRFIDESRTQGPEQVRNWIDAYIPDAPGLTEVSISLEFLNSFNTIILTSILKRISHLTQLDKQVAIHWYYEEDDIDLFERGEYISNTINIPFDFIKSDDINSH